MLKRLDATNSAPGSELEQRLPERETLEDLDSMTLKEQPQLLAVSESPRPSRFGRSRGLRNRAITTAIALGTLPVLLIGTAAYVTVSREINQRLTLQQQSTVSNLENQLERFLKERTEDLTAIARLDVFSDIDGRFRSTETERDAVLQSYIETYDVYESLIVLDEEGEAIAQAGTGLGGASRDEAFQTAVRTGQPVIREVGREGAEAATHIQVWVPIEDQDSQVRIGVVRAEVPLSSLPQALWVNASSQEEFYLIDSSGRIATTNDADDVGESLTEAFPRLSAQLQDNPASSPLTLIDRSQNGLEELLTYTPAASLQQTYGLDWDLVVAQPTEVALASQQKFLLLLLAGSGIAAIAVGILAAVLADRATRPILAAANTVARIGQGDLNARLAVDPNAEDEVATLGTNINKMAQQLSALLVTQSRVMDQARQLTSISNFKVFEEQDLTPAFDQALDSARQALAADRVVVYRFNPDWSGYISAESVVEGWPSALHDEIGDPCIPIETLESYQRDRVAAYNDVFQAGFHPDHLRLMERLQVKANLIVPILHEHQLFGLLIAHHCAQTHAWQETEVSFLRQLAAQLGIMLDQVNFVQARERETTRAQILRDITVQVTEAEDADAILTKLPLDRLRQALAADRVLVYRFDENWQGTIIAESVGAEWPKALGAQIHDPCFEKNYVDKYVQGRVQATANIYEAGLTDCHIAQLEPFAVKANLVAPIRQGSRLLGLLITHQCSGPRDWQELEINFFTQVANQLVLALDRLDLLEQRQLAAEQARLLAQEQQQQRESLQMQLLELLEDVEGASQGDLTVRADVTAGEIGTVADFFNSIVESLRQIVTQVKDSAWQVNTALGENEAAMQQLAEEADQQAQSTRHLLGSVQAMSESIQAVAESASQAAEVAQQAAMTAETSGTAMDLTVHNISTLRETVAGTAKKVKRLGESSQQISRVVSLINQIALQTNLLAINAGIEAARAGEEGQGFAVVAEEVGELAARCSTATQEIEKLVENIQLETGEVVEAMEQSTSQVVDGTRLVGNAKQSLGQILEVSAQINQLVQSISSATVSQAETSAAVAQLMQDMAQSSERTSLSSRQVSGALQQTVQVAQALQASVSAFKVGTESEDA